jgi:hypothetical protein
MKIDVTKIENYSTMTAEEKLAALETYEYDAIDNSEVDKLRNAVSKANSEAAEWKKKYNSKLSEEEKKEAERAAKEAEIQAELETLRRETAVSRYKADFIGLGYDEKLAEDTAKALADGDMAKVFANQKAHQDALAKAAKAAALAGGDPPPAGKNDPPKGDRAKLIEQYNEAEKRGDFVMCQTLQAQIKALPKE